MSRNLVICCDGTSNQYGVVNTNVARLVEMLDRSPTRQLVYYDPGVGTLPEPGFVTQIGRKISTLFGLAFGAGLLWKVAQAYTYLMNYREPGDQIFLFGFSRGAYTVRVLAALLHELGLLEQGNENLVSYAIRLFSTSREGDRESIGKYWAHRKNFRRTFARPASENDQTRHLPVHFLGVWDTVSSVGWVWDPPTYPHTANNPSIKTVRQAISLDERRCFFRQNRMYARAGEGVVQLWFSGVHCDVGGGYTDGQAWQAPFDWMLSEAKKYGLIVDPVRSAEIYKNRPLSSKPWMEPLHESLAGIWWILELFPKLVWSRGSRRRSVRIGLGRRRTLRAEEDILDKTVLQRIREDQNYRPKNLSPQFIEAVLALKEVPPIMRYRS